VPTFSKISAACVAGAENARTPSTIRILFTLSPPL
jgi:hypothetical protein